MSQLFDFSKKPYAGASPLASASRELEKVPDLRQVPVEQAIIKPECRLVFESGLHSAGADRFRFLRMRLRELWSAGKVRSLLITSPLPHDGKSTTALNLATALAEAGKRSVLLIEADLHHPSITSQLNLKPQPGLSECLERGLDPFLALHRVEPLGWYLLQAGKPVGHPTELLQSDALTGILQKLGTLFDWIVIDAPPVTPLTDALSLARHVSGCLLIAREGRTPREGLERAITLLGRERILGVILNGVAGLDKIYSGYYGYRRPEP